jgi:valyl-tRNA synthetase
MQKNLPKNYDPKSFEDRIYEAWESSGAFRAERDPDKKPFTVLMPPPNITGQLHMGHALDQSLQDVLIRFKRMQGYSALWLPGTDHASIATEVKVVEKIKAEEGLTKEDLGREEFLKRVWDWKEQYGGTIERQARKLGDSCDWSRKRFTMDDQCNKAVVEHFCNLYEAGLIYRGKRLINWCPVCGSALSDIEVEHVDRQGKYWYFRYPGADGGEGITVATSRPETMFADVAIAVNPDDERYKDMVGKTVLLPLVNREIPIIADPYPDPEKGTGAVKITPAADPNDFEVGQRHGLEILVCIDEEAKMTELAGKYAGMDRYECRKAWVADLDAAGYLVKTEDLTIPTGECYRCHTVVEPMISEQWFVKMKPLAEPALKIARTGELKFVPERFEKIYYHWLEEIRDWCISRQLWWGHRIPAYYCEDCGEMTVAREPVTVCPKCGSVHIRQDEDVLDTWFSSGLWPISTLGWPDKDSEDFKYFYPTSTLVTGYDIIFFWVARMAFACVDETGKSPFDHVLIHGLVRDSQGRKMSKSLGNGIDPLEIIDKYGADALRFMLLSGIAPGSDIRYSDDKVESARNFANKLWNASRFVIMNLQDEDGNALPLADLETAELRDEDKWLFSRISDAIADITGNMEKFEFALAAAKIYDLTWDVFCDWYIELVKPRLWNGEESDRAAARAVIVEALRDILKLLHPFMPFITEEIWSALPGFEGQKPFLMLESWPEAPAFDFGDSPEIIETAKACIKAIRNIRAEADAPNGRKLHAAFAAAGREAAFIEAARAHISSLAGLEGLSIGEKPDDSLGETMSAALPGIEIYVPMDELVDYAAEYERLKKEKERLEKEVVRAEAKLANESFTSKAPAAVIEKERAKLANFRDMLEKTLARIPAVEAKLGK